MGPLQHELCVFEEGGKEVLVATQEGEGVGGMSMQIVHVDSGMVGLASVLDVAPCAFHGIQLRTIRRQVLEAKPGRMLDREVLGRLEMGRKIIPDEHDPAAKTIVQVMQERDEKGRIDAAVVQLKREIHPTANRRDRKRADCRESVAPGRFDQDGCLPRGSPGPADGRLKHETRFVQEHYRLAPTGGPFFIRGHSAVRQRSSASGSCCRARRWGFCGVRVSCRRIFST